MEFKRTASLKPAEEPPQQLGQVQTGTEGTEQGALLTTSRAATRPNAKSPSSPTQEIAALEQQALDTRPRSGRPARGHAVTVQGMNKAALTEYAQKYDHAFDAKAKVDDMRITVTA